MNSLKKLLYILVLVFLYGCDYVPALDEVIPDRRTDYQKSESLPDLEVPPDLTAEALEDQLVIPDEEATTLSEFEKQKRRGATPAGGSAATVAAYAGELWLTLQGQPTDIWPKLNDFWTTKGYKLDLNDADLGVLETHWLEAEGDGITVFRNKFKIISEEGGSPDNTVLFLSSERQEKVVDEGGNENWVDFEVDKQLEQKIIGEMNLHFYGDVVSTTNKTVSSPSTRTASPTKPQKKRAELLKLDEDKSYLSLPDDFSRTWPQTEEMITKAGFFIEDKNKEKGIYNIVYYPDPEEDEKEGLLSKLKFWGDDNDEGESYQVSLTGVGDKTELVILDKKGDWADYQRAVRILTLLQAQFNIAYR